MTINLAETAGFCFGVDRAVQTVNSLVDAGEKVATLGALIHNPLFVRSLESRGVLVIDEPEQLPDGYSLVIRAHGVPLEIHRRIEEMGCSCYDATCPFVAKIQKIVAEESGSCDLVIITGDAKHPEVLGIASRSRVRYLVADSEQMLEEMTASGEIDPSSSICMVSQTTFSKNIFRKMKIFAEKHYTKVKIFDTICNATALRQDEAVRLASENDVMIVIGGANSSNTKKLYDLCREKTQSYLIEDAGGLDTVNFKNASSIGVTAGASTPSGTIKEVIKHMSEITNIEATATAGQAAAADSEEMNFAQALEENLSAMNNDKEVVGIVAEITPTEVRVDIPGRKQTGIVPVEELTADPTADPLKDIKVGDEIKLVIMKTNDVEGTIKLSKKLYDRTANWQTVVDAYDAKEILEGVVGEVLSSGVIISYNGIRVFVPGKLTGIPRDGRLEELLNQTVKFVLIELDQRRKSAKGSISTVTKALNKEKAAAFWAEAEEGKKYTGTVKSLTDFGAFVDLGGVDGLVHRTELSWKRIKHPSEVVAVGDEIEVYIKSLDRENNKISLGYKKIEDSPWEVLKRDCPAGSEIEVKIVRLTTFGAFAEIFPRVEGLIHVSEISWERVAQPQDVLSVGETVKVKVLNIDDEKKRVSLSIKALVPAPERAPKKAVEVEEEASVEAPAVMSIEDMIAKANEAEAEAATEEVAE